MVKDEIRDIEERTKLKLKDWTPLEFARLGLEENVRINMSTELLKYLSESEEIDPNSKDFFYITHLGRLNQEALGELEKILDYDDLETPLEKMRFSDNIFSRLLSANSLLSLQAVGSEIDEKYISVESLRDLFNDSLAIVDKISGPGNTLSILNQSTAIELSAVLMNSLEVINTTHNNINNTDLLSEEIMEKYNSLMEHISGVVQQRIKDLEELSKKEKI